MKHKRLFSMLLAVVMAFGAIFAFAACDEGDGGNTNGSKLIPTKSLTYEKVDSYYVVTGTNDKGITSIVIPPKYKGLPVASIGEYALDGCGWLTSITISNSVTNIGKDAFRGCRELTSITVAEGNPVYHSTGNCLIETASKTLILGCSTSIIPTNGSVTLIGDSAFSSSKGLTSITIPNGVTSIGSDAFYGCSGLTSITIPNSVISIGGYVFSKCSGLTSITVEEGNRVYHSADNCIIETESKKLVSGCKTSVIPTDGSVTSIGDAAFSSCSGLTDVTIPNGVTSIEADAFSGCSGLTSIIIPASVTSIGGGAFRGCSGLTEITIPNGVTEIELGVFDGCSSLTSITIPNSVTLIRERLFMYCSALTKINYQGTMAQWKSIEKEKLWDQETVDYTIYCTDGQIKKGES